MLYLVKLHDVYVLGLPLSRHYVMRPSGLSNNRLGVLMGFLQAFFK